MRKNSSDSLSSISTPSSTIEITENIVTKTTTVELAQREAQVLQELRHIAHISKLIEYDLESGKLILEKLEPFSAKDLDLYDAAVYMKQLAKILADIHECGWIHMDISPQNIMKDGDSHLVLIDFALSCHVDEPFRGGCGTPGYVAPEVYAGNIRPVSDVYSCGVIFGQILEIYLPGLSLHYLGSKLVRSSTTTFICKKIEEFSTAGREFPSILYDAADLLYQMLQEDPEKRISAKQLVQHPFLNHPKEDYATFTCTNYGRKLFNPNRISQRSRREPIVFFRGY